MDPFSLGALKKAIIEITEVEPMILPNTSGATPVWVAAELLGCPVMSHGLNHLSHKTHAPNENVPLKEVIRQAKIIAHFIIHLGESDKS